MKLLDVVIKEFFAIVDYLLPKVPVEDGKIIVGAKPFYAFLDTKLYLPRNEKLEIYKNLNLIICNSNGFTSVVYDKETKDTNRKIIVNYDTYMTLKMLYETDYK